MDGETDARKFHPKPRKMTKKNKQGNPEEKISC